MPRYLLIEVESENVAEVTVIPAGPRDGPAEANVIAKGTARDCLLAAAGACSTAQLHQVRMHDLHSIQMQRGAEERDAARAREGLKNLTPQPPSLGRKGE